MSDYSNDEMIQLMTRTYSQTIAALVTTIARLLTECPPTDKTSVHNNLMIALASLSNSLAMDIGFQYESPKDYRLLKIAAHGLAAELIKNFGMFQFSMTPAEGLRGVGVALANHFITIGLRDALAKPAAEKWMKRQIDNMKTKKEQRQIDKSKKEAACRRKKRRNQVSPSSSLRARK